MKSFITKSYVLIVILIVSILIPGSVSANTLLQDSFSGTTIDTSKWIEHDSGANVSQNNNLISTGNGSFTTNGIESQNTYPRSSSLTIETSTRITTTLGYHLPIEYGDWNWLVASTSAYLIYFQNTGAVSLLYYNNGSLQETATAGTYSLNTTYNLKLVLKTTGADLYIDSGSGYPGTPTASLTLGTFTNKKISIASYTAGSTMTTSSLLATDSNTPPAATTYTLSGPTSGTKNSASANFTITPDGVYTGTITPHSTGSGTFTPSSLTWSGDAAVKTFTYTATSTVGSPHTISTTSSPGLTDPASIGYTVNPITVTVPVNDSHLYWSRDNVYLNGSSYALMLTMGSYLKTNFSGTSIKVNLDVSPYINASVVAGRYPVVRYQVDGGSWTTTQLTSSTTNVSVSGLSAGTHSFRFEFVAGAPFSSTDGNIDRWITPTYVIKITSLTIDESATVSTPTILSKRLRIDGDSITEGGRDIDASDTVAGMDASLAYSYLLAGLLSTEHTQLGYFGQGWNTTGVGSVSSYANSPGFYYNGVSRLSGGTLVEPPDYWVINEGTNDGTSSIATIVQTQLVEVRTEAPSAEIFVVIPFNGGERTNITTGYNNYIAAHPSDTKTHLIDLGSISYTKTDGLHPTAAGHITLANALAAAINTYIDTTAPTVSITAPTNSSIVSGSSVTISANASDNISVAGVQFKLDGVNLQSEDTSSPYQITWDTTAASDGSHTITAIARDPIGNTTTSSPITVTVNNTPAPTPTPSTPAIVNYGHPPFPPANQQPYSAPLPTPSATTTAVTGITRNIFFGVTGEDVRALQKYLNAQGFIIATTGAGSPGHETTYFGALTRAAVVKFQRSHNISPAVGYFGPLTRAYINSLQ